MAMARSELNRPSGRSKALCLAAADVNGDGLPDLLVADSADNRVSVLLGTGDGAFRRAGCRRWPAAVAVAGRCEWRRADGRHQCQLIRQHSQRAAGQGAAEAFKSSAFLRWAADRIRLLPTPTATANRDIITTNYGDDKHQHSARRW